MNNSNSAFLPIGTVCRLKNGTKKLMIVGFCNEVDIENNSAKKMYDYIGCIYPEGIISSEFSLMFDNNQIEEILFKGYENEEEKIFKNRLTEFINTGKIDGVEIKNDENVSESLIRTDINPTKNDVSSQSPVTNTSVQPMPISTEQQSSVNNVKPAIFNTLNINQSSNNQ